MKVSFARSAFRCEIDFGMRLEPVGRSRISLTLNRFAPRNDAFKAVTVTEIFCDRC
jgi:hypothetical protein